jgi:hypothetical protein
MNVCLVGGIFDRPEAVRSSSGDAETVLLDGFRKAGVTVHAVGHAGFQPSDDYDIIHVHHRSGGPQDGVPALPGARRLHRPQWADPHRLGALAAAALRLQYVVDRAEAYIALSRAEARYYAGVTSADKIHTIPNGIPADVFRAAGHRRKRADKERYDVLYVGQLIDWKGVNFLLEAMQRLRRQRDVHLRLVYHNAELEADLRRQADDLGIAKHVEFVGILDPGELAEEYQQADLLVLPSFADCLPSVVTGRSCAARRWWPAGSAACRSRSDPTAWRCRRAIRSRSRTPMRGRSWRIGSAGAGLAAEIRAYAEQTFKPETMVARHLALYRDMVEGRAASVRRRAAWIDPAMRLAVEVYWRRRRAAA